VNLPYVVELGAFCGMTAVRYERELCEYAEPLGYHAERVAGSGRGRLSVCDIVLMKDGRGYLVEVKSTRNDTYYVSDKPETRQRLQDLINVSEKCEATPLLAVRFKRRGKRRRWVIKKLDENLSRVNPQEETLF
jgi:Holliday junction resolvase